VLGADPGGTVSLGVLEIAHREAIALTAVRPEIKGFSFTKRKTKSPKNGVFNLPN
jgi:hypothetical protein